MHIPVLLNETISLLEIVPTDVVLDGTVNGAGHAQAIVPLLGSGQYIACDADTEALKRAHKALAKWENNVQFVHANFKDLAATLATLDSKPTKYLFDLGWSMNQFDDPERGFSFQHDGPLDMRYDPSAQALTAEYIVNNWEYIDLVHMLKGYAEERFAPLIARKIIAARQEKPIKTTHDLAEVVTMALPAPFRHRKVHPATQTFQALRIAVNDEFGAIETGIKAAIDALPVGGRIVVITFHSLEDRIVKNMFRNACENDQYQLLVKKPLTASHEELHDNKRSRSAKLRGVIKTS